MVQPSRPKRGHLFKSYTDGSGSAKVTPERRNPIGSRAAAEAEEGILHLEGEERAKGIREGTVELRRRKLALDGTTKSQMEDEGLRGSCPLNNECCVS